MWSATSLRYRRCEKERGEAHVLFPSDLRFELGTTDEDDVELLDEVRDDAVISPLSFNLGEIGMNDADALETLYSREVNTR